MRNVCFSAIPGIPEIRSGDDLAAILIRALDAAVGGLQDFDVLILAQKVVSKAEGLLVDLSTITPSDAARDLAKQLNKDARKIEIVLRESRRVVKAFRHPHQHEGVLIAEHVSGHISANAGVDQSNVGGEDFALLLPRDPDESARKLQESLSQRYERRIGLVISDTFGRPWRMGQVNVALGAAGLPALKSDIGALDGHGRELMVTTPAFADEIAAASGLVIGKASHTPLVLARGLVWRPDENGQARDLVRMQSEDMFR